jgi:hypothetical protein
MIADDRQLRVLYALLRRVEGDAALRVQDAIRQRRRVLEYDEAGAGLSINFRTEASATDRSPGDVGT